MRNFAVQTAVVATSMMVMGTAQAADSLEIADQRVSDAHNWYVNVGLAGVLFDSSSKIDVMPRFPTRSPGRPKSAIM